MDLSPKVLLDFHQRMVRIRNLAVMNALGGNVEDLTLEITYYGPGGVELGKEGHCNPCTLAPGQSGAAMGGRAQPASSERNAARPGGRTAG